ncbi:helix-turn-helix domain-containing protein [Nocardiopsis deserti]|uniref:helix-turn-helix domain-containing protein n=1 Tax=Nocardiopsis deserti TaxID=2605988 RepID=UPI00123AA000|nr:helix-turn-helix domain-containing protein [Nocardiopsis deserti]
MYSRDVVDETFRLKALGLTDKAIATQCGVSVRAIRHWRYGNRRAPATEARRQDRTTYCPRCYGAQLDDEAYAYLLGLYLGDGHITASRRDVYVLWVFCDNKYPGLIDACTKSMETVFPVGSFLVSKDGCTAVKAASKHWLCLFPQHGPGHKHSRRIVLETWQQKIVHDRPEPFIRGLVHSDGCRVLNRIRKRSRKDEYYEYPRYHFSNTSQDIVNLFTSSLDQLSIPWTSHIQHQPPFKDKTAISVSRKEAVARMDAFVGPKY